MENTKQDTKQDTKQEAKPIAKEEDVVSDINAFWKHYEALKANGELSDDDDEYEDEPCSGDESDYEYAECCDTGCKYKGHWFKKTK